MISSSSARRFVLLFAVALSPFATARDNVWEPGEENATWRAECGACHIAFPPALLSAGDWGEIMSRLDQHFGTDASLDASTRQEISDYLKRNGASNRLFGNSEELPRITSSDRFVNKHRGAIRLWRKGQIKTLTDCVSCHKDSDRETINE